MRVTLPFAVLALGCLVTPPVSPAAVAVVAAPTVSAHQRLVSVSAVGSDDVWAVGYAVDGREMTPLVEHWDGTAWSAVDTPDLASRARLESVSALSSDDVWAVGASDLTTGPDRIYDGRTLIEHWDGTAWTRVPSPNPSSNMNQLHAVYAVATDDVWAAGNRIFDDEEPPITLTEHWDGVEWSWVKSGLDPGPTDRLLDIGASSSRDVWVVGGEPESWIQRWNGDRFDEVPVPGDFTLTGVAVISPIDTWVVGHSSTLQWDGATWHSVRNAGIGRLQGISAVSTSDV